MIIHPNDKTWEGVAVRRPIWDAGNYALVTLVGRYLFIGDYYRAKVKRNFEGHHFWIVEPWDEKEMRIIDDWEVVE